MKQRLSICLLISLFMVILFAACKKVWDYEKIEPAEIFIDDIAKLSFDSIEIFGALLREKSLRELGLLEVGFVYADEELIEVPEVNENTDSIRTQVDGTTGEFKGIISGLDIGKTYAIRAFAKSQDIYFYSPVELFEFRIRLTVEDVDIEEGGNARVGGTITGLDTGLILMEHGHFWSTDTNDLALLAVNDHTTLGERIQSGYFQSGIEGLDINETYYVRSYARIQKPEGDTVLVSPDVESFRFKDYWHSIGNHGNKRRHDGVGFSINGKGYFGLGLELDFCNAGQTSPVDTLGDFWMYDPTSNSATEIPSIISQRHGAVSFVINDDVAFVGLGRGINNTIFNDFHKYNPNNNSWQPIEDLPGVARLGAYAFVIDQTAYVGGGVDVSGQLLDDFYSFSASSETWEPNGTIGGPLRKGGVAFSIEGKGYLTLGADANGGPLLSTYCYEPGVGWAVLSNTEFPGEGREEAVVFVIDDVAFIGLGRYYIGGNANTLDDLWTFDGSDWYSAATFGGAFRHGAVAFAINGTGYVGTGLAENASVINLYCVGFSDFWLYKP